MQLIWYLSQYVSGTIMPIIRRTRPCTTHMVFCTGCAGCGCVEMGRKLCALCESYCSTESNSNFQLHTTTASTTSADHHMR